MYLRKFAYSFIFALSFANVLHADEITLVEFNPPSGFRQNLERLLETYSQTQLSSEWSSAFEADVWVSFVKNHQDNLNLPIVAQDILLEAKRNYAGPLPEAFLIFEGNVNERHMKIAYFFMDGSENSSQVLACEAATLLALELEYINRAQAVEESANCRLQ